MTNVVYLMSTLMVDYLFCDIYNGQAIRELSECLWGKRYLDGFGQHEIVELIEWISVL